MRPLRSNHPANSLLDRFEREKWAKPRTFKDPLHHGRIGADDPLCAWTKMHVDTRAQVHHRGFVIAFLNLDRCSRRLEPPNERRGKEKSLIERCQKAISFAARCRRLVKLHCFTFEGDDPDMVR